MKFESLLKQMKDRLRERFSNRIGIKWGLFSGFAAFAAIILVMLWVFQIMFLGSFYKFIKVSPVQTNRRLVKQIKCFSGCAFI